MAYDNKISFEKLAQMVEERVQQNPIWGEYRLKGNVQGTYYRTWEWGRGFTNHCDMHLTTDIREGRVVPRFTVNFPAINGDAFYVAAQAILLKQVTDLAVSLQAWVDSEYVLEQPKK